MENKKKEFLQELYDLCNKYDVCEINIGERIKDLSPMSIDITFKDMDEIELPTGLGMQTLKDQIDKQD